MTYIKILILSFSTLFAEVSFAAVTDTTWFGNSELTLNGTLYCSADHMKNPVYRPVIGGPLPVLTISEGGMGWIWFGFSGGCADGWLNGYFGLQANGLNLLDKNGKTVGTIADSYIDAKNFADDLTGIHILSISIKMISDTSATANVKFQLSGKAGTFEYNATFARYHDSN